jgi:hypothetical protein
MNDWNQMGVEIQNMITAIEHGHKNELIAALTRLRNIFFARGAEIPEPDRATLPINWHDQLDARGRPVDSIGRLIK